MKTLPSPEDIRRAKRAKASIRLRWAAAGHPTTNLQLHSLYRTLGTPRENRARNVETLRAIHDAANQPQEPVLPITNELPPIIIRISDWKNTYQLVFSELTD